MSRYTDQRHCFALYAFAILFTTGQDLCTLHLLPPVALIALSLASNRDRTTNSTGHNNEVVIIGVGATGKCKGIRGTLKSGERLLVQVDRIDPVSGMLEVMLVNVNELTVT